MNSSNTHSLIRIESLTNGSDFASFLMSKRVFLRNLSPDKNQFHQRVYFHENQTFFITKTRFDVSKHRHKVTRKRPFTQKPFTLKKILGSLTEESKKSILFLFSFCKLLMPGKAPMHYWLATSVFVPLLQASADNDR